MGLFGSDLGLGSQVERVDRVWAVAPVHSRKTQVMLVLRFADGISVTVLQAITQGRI